MWGDFDMRASYINDFAIWSSQFEFSVPVTVRFSETDMYGHLNNTVTFAYFEFARIEYFKHIGLMNDWLDPNGRTIPVVADLQCDYVKQVFFDETLSIFVKANSVGNSSADIHYMAKNGKGEIVFTGRGSIVQIRGDSAKGVSWTEKGKVAFCRLIGKVAVTACSSFTYFKMKVDRRGRVLTEEPKNRSLLTAREREIFHLLVDDQTTKDIAGRLGISEKTVRNHISNTIQKLGVSGRAQAIVELLRLGELHLH